MKGEYFVPTNHRCINTHKPRVLKFEAILKIENNVSINLKALQSDINWKEKRPYSCGLVCIAVICKPNNYATNNAEEISKNNNQYYGNQDVYIFMHQSKSETKYKTNMIDTNSANGEIDAFYMPTYTEGGTFTGIGNFLKFECFR